MINFLTRRIEERKNNHGYRERKLRNAQQLSFSSSDYLGMARHPSVIAAFKNAADDYGVSSASSSLVAGYTEAHQALELGFAHFLEREAAVLFSCGYMANLGVLSVLASRDDTVLADKLIHASLIDAVHLSQAKLTRFPHRDAIRLEQLLNHASPKNTLVITDGVFSMLGDLADLPTLVSLCNNHGATLMVDDAHGIGVLGKRGAGICEYYQLAAKDVPILVCPLAKAFGVMGAIVAGPRILIDALVQFSRTYIYTNALPPALAAAGIVSLEKVEQETWRREKLQHLIHYFRQSAQELELPLSDSITPIQPIFIESSLKAKIISEKLLEQGIALNAMRPPTVSEASVCLRASLTCYHEEDQIWQLLLKVRELYDLS